MTPAYAPYHLLRKQHSPFSSTLKVIVIINQGAVSSRKAPAANTFINMLTKNSKPFNPVL